MWQNRVMPIANRATQTDRGKAENFSSMARFAVVSTVQAGGNEREEWNCVRLRAGKRGELFHFARGGRTLNSHLYFG